ncbi:hypothetical protein EVAR_64881_1 [Eumeta japonica]|uniref:Uncharacterized protein n=1 Tax=Eumeta variegata TaxID=151549 RepID=A0A4C2A8G1_EUMVA|nr:hypothetical protein EVAR_64881_1 [Eumeta japonica]
MLNKIWPELVNDATDEVSIPCKNAEQMSVSAEMYKTIKTDLLSPSSKNIKKCESFLSLPGNQNQAQYNEDKENSIICLDDTPILNNFASLKATPPSPMRPSQNLLEEQRTPVRSILAKNDLLINTSKHVKFSSDNDTVYNFSPVTNSPASSNTIATTDADSEKQPRTKSNIVVRRVVLSSKHD